MNEPQPERDEQEHERSEQAIDEALEESFPASDPPANTVETGIGIDGGVTDNRRESRFEVTRDGATGVLVYDRRPDALVLVHTEVPPELRGRHLGDVLVRGALAAARGEHRRVVPVCPFVRSYLQKHPDEAASF